MSNLTQLSAENCLIFFTWNESDCFVRVSWYADSCHYLHELHWVLQWHTNMFVEMKYGITDVDRNHWTYHLSGGNNFQVPKTEIFIVKFGFQLPWIIFDRIDDVAQHLRKYVKCNDCLEIRNVDDSRKKLKFAVTPCIWFKICTSSILILALLHRIRICKRKRKSYDQTIFKGGVKVRNSAQFEIFLFLCLVSTLCSEFFKFEVVL